MSFPFPLLVPWRQILHLNSDTMPCEFKNARPSSWFILQVSFDNFLGGEMDVLVADETESICSGPANRGTMNLSVALKTS